MDTGLLASISGPMAAHQTNVNNSKADGPSSSGSNTGRIIWWVAIAIIVASLFFIFRALPFDQLMSSLKGWVAGNGYWGPLALGVVYVVATICMSMFMQHGSNSMRTKRP